MGMTVGVPLFFSYFQDNGLEVINRQLEGWVYVVAGEWVMGDF